MASLEAAGSAGALVVCTGLLVVVLVVVVVVVVVVEVVVEDGEAAGGRLFVLGGTAKQVQDVLECFVNDTV